MFGIYSPPQNELQLHFACLTLGIVASGGNEGHTGCERELRMGPAYLYHGCRSRLKLVALPSITLNFAPLKNLLTCLSAFTAATEVDSPLVPDAASEHVDLSLEHKHLR